MIEKKCSVCGQISEYNETFDFSKLQDADLGGTPKFADGDSFESMVERCPFCGYCSFDITKNVLKANKLLQTEGYQYIINSGDMPDPIANMAAVAYIYECENVNYVSARAHSFASKMLEEIGESERWQMFKEQEARLLLLHIQTEYFKKHFDIKVYQYLIDALRRLKKFDKATQFCDIALTKTYASVQRNIFYLEKSLCMNFISEPHEFGDRNGEFNNFYQILIQAFGTKQSAGVYKELYEKTRAYLEKCVYFPIADGADFIIKIDKAETASMDEMIVQLRGTYDKVRGLKKEETHDIKVQAEEEITAKKEIKVYPEIKKQPKILTLQSIEEEKDAVEKYAKLKEAHSALESENSEILSQLVASKNDCETLGHNVNILQAKLEKAEEKLKIANEELQNKNAILSNKDEIIKEKESVISSKEEFSKTSENLLAEKEAEISNLQFALAESENQLASLQNEKSNMHEELEEVIKSRRELTATFDLDIYKLQQENSSLKMQIEKQKESATMAYEELPEELPQDEYFDNFGDEEFENQNEYEEAEEFQEFDKSEQTITENEEIIQEINDEYINEFMGEEEDMAEFVLDDITEEMILSIAKISGQIDVSEVQGMLLVGYKNAKYALDKIAGDGKLSETEEDVYKFIEV